MSGRVAAVRWAPPVVPTRRLVRYAWSQMRCHRVAVATALIAVLLGATAVAASPVILRVAIDDGIRAGDEAMLLRAGLVYLLVIAAGGLLGAVRVVAMAVFAQDLLHHLRTDAVSGVLGLDLAEFERADRGDLQARVTSGVDSLAGASMELLPDTLGHLIAVAGGFAAVAVLSPTLALVSLLFLPPSLVAGRWLLRRSTTVYPELFRRNAATVGVLVETIEGAGTIAAHAAGPRRRAVVRSHTKATVEQSLRAATMRNWFYSTLLVIQSLATAAVAVGAAVLADRGSISVGTGAAAVVALTGVFGPLSWVLGGLDGFLQARTALRRVGELALLAPPVAPGGPTLPARSALTFSGVRYAYADGPDVLADVTLRVAPGERVAIVGPTGAGKSTLARLATGLATPAEGTVRLGDVDVTAASDRAERLVLITQETHLIDASIADNVRLATPASTDAEIAAAAERLGLDRWLASLPDGLDTPVGPDGALLSLGERQLVAVLRATVRDAAVLVLDEATSILDPATEAAVATALERAGADRVVLVIAHRPQTAARCDRIVEVRGGRVTERRPR